MGGLCFLPHPSFVSFHHALAHSVLKGKLQKSDCPTLNSKREEKKSLKIKTLSNLISKENNSLTKMIKRKIERMTLLVLLDKSSNLVGPRIDITYSHKNNYY